MTGDERKVARQKLFLELHHTLESLSEAFQERACSRSVTPRSLYLELNGIKSRKTKLNMPRTTGFVEF